MLCVRIIGIIFVVISFKTADLLSVVVELTNDGPVVRGANITFKSTVLNYVGGELKFKYDDNLRHSTEMRVTSNDTKYVSTWVMQYSQHKYRPGNYTATVDVMKNFYLDYWISIGTAETSFQLTDKLNGNLTLKQNDKIRTNNFVAINDTVSHVITLPENEMNFLNQNSSTITSYWFIDCMFIDKSDALVFNYTYEDIMGDHYLDVLVIADNEPLPPLTTTMKPVLEVGSNKTINGSTLYSDNRTIIHEIRKRDTDKCKPVQDFICHDTGILAIDDCHTYGHYKQSLSVRAPISSVNITGLNWLQHGDLLNLQVKYTGSPPFNYCVEYKMGQYNITGDETCSSIVTTKTNGFPVIHYFSDGEQHTVVVIVENVIGKNVSRATIKIYKASVHPQLSVIVVPVGFCLLAVTLVIFGVAYYQHRSRYTIEVADFDFGQAHLEYKTFYERLRDSFKNALNFGDEDDHNPLTSNTRYNSMT